VDAQQSIEYPSTNNRSSVVTSEHPIKRVQEIIINDQTINKMNTQQLKQILKEQHQNEMTLKIYIDPEVDGKEIYACPDGNPLLHEDCRQASLYARQHVLFLSEQIEH
jgi:hypothetical protein